MSYDKGGKGQVASRNRKYAVEYGTVGASRDLAKNYKLRNTVIESGSCKRVVVSNFLKTVLQQETREFSRVFQFCSVFSRNTVLFSIFPKFEYVGKILKKTEKTSSFFWENTEQNWKTRLVKIDPN